MKTGGGIGICLVPESRAQRSRLPGFSRNRRRRLACRERCSPARHQTQINKFTLPPTPQSFPNLLAEPGIWNKSIVKLSPAAISSAVVPGCPAPLRQSHKTAIVKRHHVSGDSAPDAVERQVKKFTLWITIRCRDQTDIIAAHIKKERSRHQLGVSHVVVFVFVQTFEPVTIGDQILLVVMTKPVSHIFAR